MSASLTTQPVTKTVTVDEPAVTLTLSLEDASALLALVGRCNGMHIVNVYNDLNSIQEIQGLVVIDSAMPSVNLNAYMKTVGSSPVQNKYLAMSIEELAAVVEDQTGDDPDFFPVRDLMRSDKKIQAIKALRALTGVGLKQAKDTLDSIHNYYAFGGR